MLHCFYMKLFTLHFFSYNVLGLNCCKFNHSRYSFTAVPLLSHSISGLWSQRISPLTLSISMISQVLTTAHKRYMMPWLMLLSMSASMRGTFLRLVKGLLAFSSVRCALFYHILCNVASKTTLIFPNRSLRKLWQLKLHRMKMAHQSWASSRVFLLNGMQRWSYM